MDLEGRVALITGASSGVGQGIALVMAEAGADVVVNYRRNKEGADRTVADIQAKGRRAISIQADVRDLDRVQAMVEASTRALGKVDILVNNAGIHGISDFMAGDAVSVFRDMIDTHLFGSFNCTQAVLPTMRQQDRGDILFITTLATKQLWAAEWAYITAKSAMETLAQCIAKELSWHGIRVNCVAPTVVETDLGRDLVLGWAGLDDSKELQGKIPFDRMIQPYDVGKLCVFLASDKASHISGQVVFIDCGIGPGGLVSIVSRQG